MAFSSDSQRLLTGRMDGTIQSWDTKSKKLLHKFQGLQGSVMSLALSPNGQFLAIGGTNGTTELWSIKGQQLAKLQGHQGNVNIVAFSPDGKQLVTSEDQSDNNTTVRLYQIGGELDERLAMNCDGIGDYLKKRDADISESDSFCVAPPMPSARLRLSGLALRIGADRHLCDGIDTASNLRQAN